MAEAKDTQSRLNFVSNSFDATLIVLILLWALAFNQGISSAYQVWITSEIFNHCLFVVPIMLFLVYRQRAQVLQAGIQPTAWFALLGIPIVLVYVFALLGDIAILMHVAAFSFLPLIFITLIGFKGAKKIAFPLFFSFFAIPFGEALIPYLQQIAAHLSVFLLNLSGIATYVNGLYIEIAAGRFLVAEACSGISFFIVSVVFGCLYAHIHLSSKKRKAAFIALSFGVPLLANGVRVFGIIVIAHLSDMKYAVGADHLIYGWVFYCFVLLILLFIGRCMQSGDRAFAAPPPIPPNLRKTQFPWFASISLLALFLSQIMWIQQIRSEQPATPVAITFLPNQETLARSQLDISFTDADKLYLFTDKINKVGFEYLIAQYVDNSHGELVSGLNKRYSEDKWSLVSQKILSINATMTVTVSHLTSPSGRQRILVDWYQINVYSGASAIKAKLLQTINKVVGQNSGGFRVMISAQLDDSHAQQALETQLSNQAALIQEKLANEHFQVQEK